MSGRSFSCGRRRAEAFRRDQTISTIANGAEKRSVFEAQIRYTVEEHAKKQAMLEPLAVVADMILADGSA